MSEASDAAIADDLIACPQCDRLHRLRAIPTGATARCSRCRAVLLAPRRGAITLIVSLSMSALVLMVAAIAFPFLRIEAAGLASRASVLDAVTSFAVASGLMAPLSALLAALIVLLPAARLAGLVYVLAPLSLGYRPAADAPAVFRTVTRLRPWAMAEIFIIGVAVALIKVASLAQVEFGPSFWAFTALVMMMAGQDAMICERSIWRILDPR